MIAADVFHAFLYGSDWILWSVFWLLVLGLFLIAWRAGHWAGWKKYLRWFAVCILIILGYARLVEPRLLTVKTYKMPLIPQPKTWVKAVFLFDAHAGRDKGPGFYRRVAERVGSLEPDVIFVGGDFVDQDSADMGDLRSWADMTAPLGKYFVLGNHDYYGDPQAVRSYAQTILGMTDVTNAILNIKKDDRSFTLIGLDDAKMGTPDLALVNDPAAKRPRVIFSHQPDILLSLPSGVAEGAMFGHTHGGQVRLPWIGSLAILPQRAPQWLDRGWKYWRGTPLVISQGLGEATAPLRLFDPPQIMVVEIGI
ncbi:MAG: metallophosphoesterase [Patescibacteria group bacterium]